MRQYYAIFSLNIYEEAVQGVERFHTEEAAEADLEDRRRRLPHLRNHTMWVDFVDELADA